jgi:hypothetical protein
MVLLIIEKDMHWSIGKVFVCQKRWGTGGLRLTHYEYLTFAKVVVETKRSLI